jgi:MYXO-CTERM domain-containing protein
MPRRPLRAVLLGMSFTLLACHAPELSLSQRQDPIVGGTVSPDGFIPSVGALVVNFPGFYQSFCTATLISDRLALTAGHCAKGVPWGTPVGFFTGTDIRSPTAGSRIIPVTSMTAHPSFTNNTPPGGLADYFDIAVVQLGQTTAIAPMKLVRPSEVGKLLKYNAPLLIVGFGLSNPNDQNSSGVKRHGSSTLNDIGSSEIWIGGSPAQACNGDSGGPTLANAGSTTVPDYRTIGVASRVAEGCEYGCIETRVDSYLTWIHSQGTIPCGSGLSDDCGTTPPPPPPPPKELGASCAAASDCKGNLCIIDPTSKSLVCSQLCATAGNDCPAGYDCRPISGTSNGACVKQVAVTPPKKGLGETCADSKECQSALCATQGDLHFCSALCTPGDAACGETMTCSPAGSQYACTPKAEPPNSSSGSGGCAVGAGTPFAPWPALLLVALALRRRRRQ